MDGLTYLYGMLKEIERELGIEVNLEQRASSSKHSKYVVVLDIGPNQHAVQADSIFECRTTLAQNVMKYLVKDAVKVNKENINY